MHIKVAVQVALVFALAQFSSATAIPTDDSTLYYSLSKRTLTPDNTCGDVFNGNNNSYTCNPAALGCCSQYGYCGNATAYCGTGCQPTFGTCAGSESILSDPDQCGPSNGDAVCLAGLCCSAAGWCGNTTDYCSTGCQSSFGDCSPSVGGDGAGTCGPAFNNQQCPSGQCCSPAGYCGTTEDYCQDPTCQFQYGTCDSDTTPAGTSTLTDPRPLLGSVSYTNDIYDCVEENAVALTYDDGPYNYTNELLDVLQQFGFHATFFITGNNLGKGPIDTTAPYPTVIQRMIAEGHQVASHTWSHYSLQNITSDMRKQQMVKNERALANIIGYYPTYMRPPYSQCDAPSGCQADLQSLGYHRIYFDLDTQDYLNPLPTQIQNSKNIVEAALTNTAGQGVTDYLSIQHDIVEQSVANLTSYYYGLIQANGWKGVTAGECLGDPQKNWYRTPGTGAGVSLSSTLKSTTSTPALSISTKTSTSVSTTKSVSSTSTIISVPISTTKLSSLTSTTKSTSTSSKQSISVAVAAVSTCAVQAGKFCGTIASFVDKAGCMKSAASCYLQETTCSTQAGSANTAKCTQFNQICQKLNQYCATCGSTCSSTAFSA